MSCLTSTATFRSSTRWRRCFRSTNIAYWRRHIGYWCTLRSGLRRSLRRRRISKFLPKLQGDFPRPTSLFGSWWNAWSSDTYSENRPSLDVRSSRRDVYYLGNVRRCWLGIVEDDTICAILRPKECFLYWLSQLTSVLIFTWNLHL